MGDPGEARPQRGVLVGSKRQTIVRKTLMWLYRNPSNPYIAVTGVVDFANAKKYLESLPGVTLHHLVAATVGRVLKENPPANARIVRNRIQHFEHVNMIMPVHIEAKGGGEDDLGLAHVEEVDCLSLRGLASACGDSVVAERSRRPKHPAVRLFTKFAEWAPYPVVSAGLSAIDRILQTPFIAEEISRRTPVSTCVSNAGAVFQDVEGALVRGVSAALPSRLLHLGSLWAVSAIQDEVIPIDGKPKVRPVLPVILVFDHRLFDGVMAANLLKRFAAIMLDPAAVFGAKGEDSPPA